MLGATQIQEYCLGYIKLGACLTSLCHEGNLCHSMGEVSWWGLIAPFQQVEVFHPYVPLILELEHFPLYPPFDNMLLVRHFRGQCLEEGNSRIRDGREPIE